MRLASICAGGLLGVALTGCATPPPEVYVTGPQSASAATAVEIGDNQVGEPCRYQSVPSSFGIGARRAIAVYCGGWQQPSGRIFELDSAGPAQPGALAAAGPWRSYIDQRFACSAPTDTRLLDGAPAILMQCTRRLGGWPHLAIVAVVGGRVFAADGVAPALPALEATIAALAGRQAGTRTAAPRSEAAQLIAGVSAGGGFGAGDEGRYYELTRAGDAYNNIDDPAHAEQAFREALAVQQHYLAPDNPGLALTMMKLAAQIAHQRNAPEADRMLEAAAKLTARANDPLLAAQLDFYRAVTAAYQGNSAAALQQVQLAEQAFTRLLPPGAAEGAARGVRAASPVAERSQGGQRAIQRATGGRGDALLGIDVALLAAESSITGTTAITGLAETLRLHANLAQLAGNIAESTALAQRADRLLEANGLAVSSTAARARRQLASNEASAGNYSAALSDSVEACRRLERVVPEERPVAICFLQQGAYRMQQGDSAAALALFERAGKILRRPSIEIRWAQPDLILPWLDALYGAAERTPAERPRLHAEMFEAAQLARSSLTAQEIAQAAARLAASDPRVATALRNLQDKQRELDRLEQDRVDLAEGDRSRDTSRIEELDKRIAAVQQERDDADQVAQSAAPLYRKTIQQPVTEAELRELLQPGEALLSVFVAPGGSYGMLLQRDGTFVYRIPLKQADIAALVQKLRESSQPKAVDGQVILPNFDTGAANRLYAALFGPAEQQLTGKSRLTVAASGALLSFPLGALVTAPDVAVEQGDYRRVPFLLRRFALSYVPAPRTFVDLRRIKTGAPGARPFIGFGDFRPATDRQIAQLFPPERCAQDNRLLHLLGPLPGTKLEVVTIGRQLGAAPGDIVLGDAFTKARLIGEELAQYRIVHLATHALLPTELGQCQTDPAILTSVPSSAASAAAGFLGVGDIENLKLNADLVVLSACDTAGPGNGAGESLSGLAQAFFRAGTRGMLVTDWGAADVAAMRLMTDTLAPAGAATAVDTAQALRNAQLRMIDTAGGGAETPLQLSHPYAWAPFVLIGDGVRARSPGA